MIESQMSKQHDNGNEVVKALEDARQELQDALALTGQHKSAPPLPPPPPPPDVDPEDLAAAAFFAKQQPAGLDVREWAAIIVLSQQQQGNKLSEAADDRFVKDLYHDNNK